MRFRLLVLAAVVSLVSVACRSSSLLPDGGVLPDGGAALGASESVALSVPASMAQSPFDKPRTLMVPPHFSAAVYARIGGARFMTFAPDGDLLVSRPGAGSVSRVHDTGTGTPTVSDFLTGLHEPHDLVFHTVGGQLYLYLSEANEIDRYPYANGGVDPAAKDVVVANLPSASLPELHGAYAHELKNIALDGDDHLYVSVASATNSDPSDTTSVPVRGAVYQANADGTGWRLYARGIRNAEGLAFIPGTNTLWVAVNNRDNLAYPFHDALNAFGQVLTPYVDNHPPEEFTALRDGGNLGWPFCNPDPDQSVNTMPFDIDAENNADAHVDCGTMDKVQKGIQAHSAPLGLTFLTDTAIGEPYRQGVVIGLHGSWNRSTPTGYKVVFFPWDSTAQAPGAQLDLVTGFYDGSTPSSVWGRPVDMAVDANGALYVSDDLSGTVYRFVYSP